MPSPLDRSLRTVRAASLIVLRRWLSRFRRFLLRLHGATVAVEERVGRAEAAAFADLHPHTGRDPGITRPGAG